MSKAIWLILGMLLSTAWACDLYIGQGDIPATLDIEGATYCLNESINLDLEGSLFISIASADVTFNCSGYGMTGGSADWGVEANYNGARIVDCGLSNFGIGAVYNYIDGGEISGSTFSENVQAMDHYGITNNNITNNIISSAVADSIGIELSWGSTGVNIVNNSITVLGTALKMDEGDASYGNTIINNVITSESIWVNNAGINFFNDSTQGNQYFDYTPATFTCSDGDWCHQWDGDVSGCSDHSGTCDYFNEVCSSTCIQTNEYCRQWDWDQTGCDEEGVNLGICYWDWYNDGTCYNIKECSEITNESDCTLFHCGGWDPVSAIRTPAADFCTLVDSNGDGWADGGEVPFNESTVCLGEFLVSDTCYAYQADEPYCGTGAGGGNYAFAGGTLDTPAYAYDADKATVAHCFGYNDCLLYVNYTKPDGFSYANTTVWLTISQSTSFPIPDSCFSQETVYEKFVIGAFSGTPNLNVYCYNGVDWSLVGTRYGVFYLAEQQITWIDAGQTPIKWFGDDDWHPWAGASTSCVNGTDIVELPCVLPNASTAYTVSSDLTSPMGLEGITVANASITIDCQGNSLAGTSGTVGIYSNQQATTITNCDISGFQTPISFDGADNSVVDNVEAYSSGTTLGVVPVLSISASSGISISNSIFSGELSFQAILSTLGLLLNNSNSIVISDTVFAVPGSLHLTYEGAYFTNSSNNQITNSYFYGSPWALYMLNSNNNNITNAPLSAPAIGFYLGNSHNNILQNVTTSGTTNGNSLLSSNGNSIIDSTMSTSPGVQQVLTLTNSSNNSLLRNNFTSWAWDVKMVSTGTTTCTNNTFLENIFTGDGWLSIESGALSPNTGNVFSNSTVGNKYYTSSGVSAATFCNIGDTNGDNWADVGNDLPFYNGTACFPAAYYWVGPGEDWHPWAGPATMSFYDACISNYTQYGANRSYIERYVQCSMGRIVGNSEVGGLLLGLIVGGLFLAFILFQNTRIEAKIVVIIPVIVLVSIWAGWIMYLAGLALGLIVFWALSRLINR